MAPIRYLLITAALLVIATWAIHTYRTSVLDAEFLVYGQSVTVGGTSAGRGSVKNPFPAPTAVRQSQNAITLERTTCFGACPAYLLQIDSSGAVSFRQGPPSTDTRLLVSQLNSSLIWLRDSTSIHFFKLNDDYEPIETDGQQTYLQMTLTGKTTRIAH